jgi:GntR family transcriptional regulator
VSSTPPEGAVARVETQIRERLRRGKYSPGSKLPPERQLALDLSVSRSTIRTGLQNLAEEGLLLCSAKRGWFVPQKVVGEPAHVLQSFTQMAETLGLRPGSKVIWFRERSATFDEANTLGIAPGSIVYNFERVRTMDEVPIAVDRTVINAQYCQGLQSSDLADASLYTLLETRFGVSILRSDYSLQAQTADQETAALLGISTSAPVLVGEDTVIGERNGPLMLSQITYRGDAYRFRTSLYR